MWKISEAQAWLLENRLQNLSISYHFIVFERTHREEERWKSTYVPRKSQEICAEAMHGKNP